MSKSAGYLISHIMLIYLITGCSLNYERIVITGIVVDSETKKAIVGAEVIGNCMYYDSNIVDYSMEKQRILKLIQLLLK